MFESGGRLLAGVVVVSKVYEELVVVERDAGMPAAFTRGGAGGTRSEM